MKILKKKDYSYILFEEEGKTYLYVLCGTVGVYELIIELSIEEKMKYINNKEKLEKFVYEITSSPDSFRSRKVGKSFTFPKAEG